MNPALRPAVAASCAALVLSTVGCSVHDRAAADRGPTFPKTWDERVQPYVTLAEDLRELEFKHPVQVDFQSPEAFEKGLSSDEGDLDKEERKEIEQWTGMLRAMGVLHGDVDLFAESEKLTTGGTLAYYSFDDQRIFVRGTKITPAVKSTLVHELVHALQDQNFEAGKRTKELADAEDSAGLAWDALVEGDASRIETLYAEKLTPAERRALRRDEAQQADTADDAIADVPEILQTMMGAPYALGEALLDVATLEGNDEVDKLFRRPPRTEENLVDPFTWTWDRQKAAPVKKPSLPKGAKKFDDGTFEATGWLFTLAARLPAREALTATDGWGGDKYLAYTDAKKRTCVDVRYVGDTAKDADELAASLTTWISKGPADTAHLTREGKDGLLFSSCDPGKDAPGSAGSSAKALDLALSRTYVVRSLIEQDWPHDPARCFGTALVQNFTPAQIQADEAPPETVAEFQRLARGCGA